MLGTLLRLLSVVTGLWLPLEVIRLLRIPRVPREARSLLEGLRRPTRQEIERYVPEPFRHLGSDWSFTRGCILTSSERRKTRWIGSLGGFDVERSFGEEYFVYRGVYGYYDHQLKVQAFRMPPTENERLVRPGRVFIICFNRHSPRRHHVFPLVRQAD